jgi:hypothetical protein
VKKEFFFHGVGLEQVVDAIGVIQASPAYQSMNVVAFVKKQFSKIGTVLPCYPCYEGCP